jgi:hypothetical protein
MLVILRSLPYITLSYAASADTEEPSFGRFYLSHLPIFQRTILVSSHQDAYTLQKYSSSPQTQIKGFNAA